MTENYSRLSILLVDVAGKVLRNVLEKYYTNSGISDFGAFMEANLHKLFHVWKPDIQCCDPRCFHLARRTRALLSNSQWDSISNKIKHEHTRHFQFCPCQYTARSSKLENLDLVTSIVLVQVLTLNLPPNVINALTELRIHRNNLVHAKSSSIDMTKFIASWHAIEQAILTIAGTVSRDYQEDIRETIKKLTISSVYAESESLQSSSSSMSSLFTSPPESLSSLTSVSSMQSSIDVISIDEKLQKIQTDVDEIKSDVSFIKHGYGMSYPHPGLSKESLEIADSNIQPFGGLDTFSNPKETLSTKMDKVIETTIDVKHILHSHNQKFLDIDKKIDNMNNKFKMFENQNVIIQDRLNDIKETTKSIQVSSELGGSEPVSVYNVRHLKEIKMKVVGDSNRTLSPRDRISIETDETFPKEHESNKDLHHLRETYKMKDENKDTLNLKHRTDSASEGDNTETEMQANSDKIQSTMPDLTKYNDDGEKVTDKMKEIFEFSDEKRKTIHLGKIRQPEVENVVSLKDRVKQVDEMGGSSEERRELVHLQGIKKTDFNTSDYFSIESEQLNRSTSGVASIKSPSEAVRFEHSNVDEKESTNVEKEKVEIRLSRQSSIEVDGETESFENRFDSKTFEKESISIESVEKEMVDSEIRETEQSIMETNIPDELRRVIEEAERQGQLVSDSAEESENDKVRENGFENDQKPRSRRLTPESEGAESVKSDFDDVDEGFNRYIEMAGLPHNSEIWKIVVKSFEAHFGVPCRSKGIDTVLCLDISASMKGKAFEQMISVALFFVENIENIAIDRGLEENVAVVVFGHDTKIAQELTNDYTKIRQAIEGLSAGGTSPMLTGLMLSYMAIDIAGGSTSIQGHVVNPRIILLSDGRPTDDVLMNQYDIEFAQKDPQVRQRIVDMAAKLYDSGYSVFCIPIGQSSNRDFLNEIAGTSGGKVFAMDKAEFLAKEFQYQNIAGKVIARLGESANIANDIELILTEELDALAPDFTYEDREYIEDILRIKGILDEDEEYNDLPPPGTRVADALDIANKFGTVIKHVKNDQIEILWDSRKNEVRVYTIGENNVRIIDEPVILERDELIQIGVRVTRGPAWKVEYNDQDGGDGSFGIVYLVKDIGVVKVKWENGNKHSYRFDGVVQSKNEVKIHETSLPKKEAFQNLLHSVGLIKSTEVTPEVTGTGFRVGGNYILTAFHIISHIIHHRTLQKPLQMQFTAEDTMLEEVTNFISFRLMSEVVYFDENMDVAVLQLIQTEQPFPPPVPLCSHFINVSELKDFEIWNIFGFASGSRDIMKLKCKPVRHDSLQVQNATEWVSNNYKSELAKYKGITDPNKIILKSSHWQNGMDGAVVAVENENEAYVVCLYLKVYDTFTTEQHEKIHLSDEYIFEQGILLSAIKAKIRGINLKLCEDLFMSDVAMVWQMEVPDGDWVDFPTDINEKLETSHTMNRDKTCIITFQGESIRILFKDMKARILSDARTPRSVRRTLKKTS